MTPQHIKVVDGRIGINNAFARMPFRFGVVTIEAVANATLELDVLINGKYVKGYASDLLAYKWFDKRADKTPEDNVTDLLWVVQTALDTAKNIDAGTVFSIWKQLDDEIHRLAIEADFNHLGASFGVSMIERAMIDALGRATGQSFFQLVQANSLALQPATIFPELGALSLVDILPKAPLNSIALRHTVGLVDPITKADMSPQTHVNDGLPETLQDYIETENLSYLKIKVGGNSEADLDRLQAIADLMERYDRRFYTTLDGNEQYKNIADFAALMDIVRSRPSLQKLYNSIMFIEQPLDRAVALSQPLDQAGMNIIGKPLLIDEADGWTTAYKQAIELGYHGVSHKNCKGVIRSLLNAMLVHHHNEKPESTTHYFQSAEDLTCLPVVSLHADLAVAATLGISHAERNGHHYFKGLSILPFKEAEAALQAHPDLYHKQHGRIDLTIRDGALSVASLQVPGMGFSTLPDLNTRIRVADWSFDTLLNNPNGTTE